MTSVATSNNPIRIADILGILWSRRWIVVAAIVLCATGGILSVVYEVPIYQASISVVPAKTHGQSSGRVSGGQLAGLAALTGFGRQNSAIDLRETLAVLRSRSFTRQFVEVENLLPILFADKWSEEAQDWLPEVEDEPSLNDGVRFFDRSVRYVVVDESSGVVEINIEWTDRVLASKWANAIVDMLNQQLRDRAIRDARKAEQFLKHELEATTNIELKKSISQLIESSIQDVMIAHVNEEYALKIIDPAVVVDPENKMNLGASLKLTLSLFLGFGLGALLAIAAEVLVGPRSLRDPGDQ